MRMCTYMFVARCTIYVGMLAITTDNKRCKCGHAYAYRRTYIRTYIDTHTHTVHVCRPEDCVGTKLCALESKEDTSQPLDSLPPTRPHTKHCLKRGRHMQTGTHAHTHTDIYIYTGAHTENCRPHRVSPLKLYSCSQALRGRATARGPTEQSRYKALRRGDGVLLWEMGDFQECALFLLSRLRFYLTLALVRQVQPCGQAQIERCRNASACLGHSM